MSAMEKADIQIPSLNGCLVPETDIERLLKPTNNAFDYWFK